MQPPTIRGAAVEAISSRLSSIEDLYFPRAIQPEASSTSPSQRKSALHDLLSRDPALFLERYGAALTDDELQHFDALKDDYEIDWHLKRLRVSRRPLTAEEMRSRSVKVKNRRRAYLNKLIQGGQYFSEEAMREREPYLHHEYVGKFQDPTGRSMSRPGERWSETLMRRSEEAFLVAKIRGEQERLGIAPEQEEEEEEEDDVEEKNEVGDGKHVNGVHDMQEIGHGAELDTAEEALSPGEIQDQMEQFTQLMQQKFLAGEDSQHMDYSRIDNDETLDDHWLRQVNEDAEEKYFGED